MVPVSHFLAVGLLLFAIGAIGVIVRRNALIALMSIELMLNAANLTMLTFGRANYSSSNPDSGYHVFAFLVIAIAAAEAAVGLAIIVGIFRNRHSVNLDELTLMKR